MPLLLSFNDIKGCQEDSQSVLLSAAVSPVIVEAAAAAPVGRVVVAVVVVTVTKVVARVQAVATHGSATLILQLEGDSQSTRTGGRSSSTSTRRLLCTSHCSHHHNLTPLITCVPLRQRESILSRAHNLFVLYKLKSIPPR